MSEFNCTKTPIARKDHRCEECGRTIQAGETYSRTAAVWEGQFFTNIACDHCAAAREIVANAAPDFRETYYNGGLDYFLADLWQDYDLARLNACFRAKWRYQSGALMPTPEVAS